MKEAQAAPATAQAAPGQHRWQFQIGLERNPGLPRQIMGRASISKYYKDPHVVNFPQWFNGGDVSADRLK
jgi:hypothetical protein